MEHTVTEVKQEEQNAIDESVRGFELTAIKEEVKPEYDECIYIVPLEPEVTVKEEPEAIVNNDTDDSSSTDISTEHPYKCKKCTESFSGKRELTAHQATHKKTRHVCQGCGRVYRFLASFKSHICYFLCNECNKKFTTKGGYRNHLSNVHGIGDVKLYFCDLCDSVYKSKRNIDVHMRNHMQQMPYKCLICDKGFSHSGALKVHSWNHLAPVTCGNCCKQFKPRSFYYHRKKCQYESK